MRLGVAVAAVCLSMVGLSVGDEARAAIRRPTHIPAEDLVPALKQLAHERGLQLVFQSEVVGATRTHGAVGEFTTSEALTRLLDGTNLAFKYLDDTTVTILRVSDDSALGMGPDKPASAPTTGSARPEAGNTGAFLLAQATSGQDQGGASVENPEQQASRKKPIQLEEVVVTGSRIPRTQKDAAQEVKIYTREQIDQSGQTNVSDFLNTLPDVSVSVSEANGGYFTNNGATTVQLHGLPIGTTLVLIDGRRVETTGLTQGFGDSFDLGDIPLAAVERVEIVPQGSSAMYGSDAIAGVVNVILKKDVRGLEANSKYSWALGTQQWDSDLSLGAHWEHASASIIGSIETRGPLSDGDRALTSNQDFRRFGGTDTRLAACNPGTVFSVDGNPLPGLGGATFAAVPAGYTGPPTIREFVPTAGTQNLCSTSPNAAIISPSRREGVLAQANYDATSSVALYTELLLSHVSIDLLSGQPILYAAPGFASFTVSPSNPYNPFGATVGIGYRFSSFPETGQPTDTKYFRPLVGAKGSLGSAWHWEAAGWVSEDWTDERYVNYVGFANSTAVQDALNSSNPATALNPFTAGPPGSPALLKSLLAPEFALRFSGRVIGTNALVRGTAFELPSGHLEVAVGTEYLRDSLTAESINTPIQFPVLLSPAHRNIYSGFLEGRIPILGSPAGASTGDRLVLTLAGRYDHYDDFGSKSTPQAGIEARPLPSILLRGTYGQSFKAPTLFSLYAPQSSFQGTITDPLRGNQTELATLVSGGNPQLRPETGGSQTLGLVYSSKTIPDLDFSVTHWKITERNAIQTLDFATIIDNENLFASQVIRATNCVGGPPCPITQVNATYVNFGRIDVAGVDAQVNFKYPSHFGTLISSVSVTETYRYSSVLVPNTAAVDSVSRAQSDFIWAPRWKGTATLGWKAGLFAINTDGRYVGKYQDYDSTRGIGNFWIVDADLRLSIGARWAGGDAWLKSAYLDIGGVNIFNNLPQFSNYGFGGVGFDPMESDIRGRFLHAQIGTKW